MNRSLLCCSLATALAIGTTLSGRAAATLQQQVDPVEVNVGDEVILAIAIQGGNVNRIHVPKVAGLEVIPVDDRVSSTSVDLNTSSSSTSVIVRTHLRALQAGDFTIPAFDVNLKDGGVLHTKPATVHVLPDSTAPVPNASTATQPLNIQQQPSFNPVGPVVMPNGNGPSITNTAVNVPMDADGHPLKLFMVITPDTTDAYVGEAVPMHIDFYLRVDINARQDSIPTINGSDFMMNPITRPAENEVVIQNLPYHHEAWVTAISAPKSGDFPLVMERDTYWLKSSNNNPDFFNSFTGPDIAHAPIGSNRLMIHVRALPEEGRPALFSGVIGHLKVSGDAAPLTVSVGEPVTVRFAISGDANFTYVRCPSLAADPAWKSYVPSARTQYLDEYHTQGTKIFDQAVIPQKGGILPLPAASFSYFDPTAKQYVTIQVALPDIAVTGAPAVIPPPPPASVDEEVTANSNATTLAPNRATLGFLADNFLPAYRQPWFWAVQGSLLSVLCLSALFTFMRRRTLPDEEDAALVQRRQSLHAEEDSMGLAVRQGDAHAFFLAARHAIQLQLGTRWKVSPEALTLGELHQRDPRLAEMLKPLFIQANEVIYSGGTTAKLDLAQWERHVRGLLQSQLQPA